MGEAVGGENNIILKIGRGTFNGINEEQIRLVMVSAAEEAALRDEDMYLSLNIAGGWQGGWQCRAYYAGKDSAILRFKAMGRTQWEALSSVVLEAKLGTKV